METTDTATTESKMIKPSKDASHEEWIAYYESTEAQWLEEQKAAGNVVADEDFCLTMESPMEHTRRMLDKL